MRMYDVYVSCGQQDLQLAARLLHSLEGCGLSCRMTQVSFDSDDDDTAEMRRAIDGCGTVIAAIREGTMESAPFLEELKFAVSCGKRIIPVLMEDCRLTTEIRFLVGGEQPLFAFRMGEKSLMHQLTMRIRVGEIPLCTYPVQEQKVNLNLIREKQFFAIDCAIKATMEDGNTHTMKNGDTVTVPLKPGKQVIQFSGSFRRTRVELDITRDMALQIKWNRITGRIDVESLSGTGVTILQKR